MQHTLLNTIRWFVRAVPEPETKNVNVQTGVHFEEVGEMLDEMKGTTPEAHKLIREANEAVKALAKYLKTSDEVLKYEVLSHKKLLDALCDQVVTGTGTAHMWGYDMLKGMDTVNASNFSKFVDGEPVFDANRKVMKGPSYFVADLSPFVQNPRF